jgi:sporulation protein YqfC
MIASKKHNAKKASREDARARRAARRAKPKLSALALPEDILGGAARLTLLGSARLLIENHRGIVSVGEDCVKLMTRHGIVTVCGRELTLRDARADALSVYGFIASVALPEPPAHRGGPDA